MSKSIFFASIFCWSDIFALNFTWCCLVTSRHRFNGSSMLWSKLTTNLLIWWLLTTLVVLCFHRWLFLCVFVGSLHVFVHHMQVLNAFSFYASRLQLNSSHNQYFLFSKSCIHNIKLIINKILSFFVLIWSHNRVFPIKSL